MAPPVLWRRPSPFDGDEPILMAIVGEGGELSAREAILGGADIVQVRAKHLNGKELTRLVRGVVDKVGSSDRIIVNARPDIAALNGCLGVHLPEEGLDVNAARRAFPGLLIGVSRHDGEGIGRAAQESADYILVGPVYESPGKGARAMGLARFSSLCQGNPAPILAVGGITPDVFGALCSAGARGVAAIRPFQSANSAHRAAREFKESLK